jgi:hypothetical protein
MDFFFNIYTRGDVPGAEPGYQPPYPDAVVQFADIPDNGKFRQKRPASQDKVLYRARNGFPDLLQQGAGHTAGDQFRFITIVIPENARHLSGIPFPLWGKVGWGLFEPLWIPGSACGGPGMTACASDMYCLIKSKLI